MKKINIKAALSAWLTTWENGKISNDFTCYDTYSDTFGKTLKKKYFAATYDKEDNIHFSIFDTKKERFNWLVDWFTKHPDDNYSGKARYSDFRDTVGYDITSHWCYKPIAGYNGVTFSF